MFICTTPIGDNAVIEQLGDTLKVLLDPERLDRQDKDRFLGVFYDFYIHWLITPFVEPQVGYDDMMT